MIQESEVQIEDLDELTKAKNYLAKHGVYIKDNCDNEHTRAIDKIDIQQI